MNPLDARHNTLLICHFNYLFVQIKDRIYIEFSALMVIAVRD